MKRSKEKKKSRSERQSGKPYSEALCSMNSPVLITTVWPRREISRNLYLDDLEATDPKKSNIHFIYA